MKKSKRTIGDTSWAVINLSVENQNKVIPTTNQSKVTLSLANENSKWKQANCLKPGNTQMTTSRLVFKVPYLIDWENGTSFLEQSQSKVKYNQRNLGLF